MPILLTNEEVEGLLTPAELVAALEETYQELSRSGADFRPRSDLYAETSVPGAVYRMRTMEGAVSSLGVAAIRIGSDLIRWYKTDDGAQRQQHVPAARGNRWVGLVLLFDVHTGEPLLIYPDGALQRLRVGATTTIAAKALARPDSRVHTVLGSGNQARGVVRSMATSFELEEVRVFSTNPRRREAFAAEMAAATGLRVQPFAAPEEAVKGADIVSCATNSLDPVFFAAWLEPGMHLGAIEWCELEDDVYRRLDVTAIHLKDGEVRNHARAVPRDKLTGLDKHDMEDWMRELPEISELMNGAHPGRISPEQTTAFVNNVGCGLQFAAAGKKLYEAAKRQGVGRELPIDWFLQEVPS